jgi:hypothetical protein
MVAKAGRRVNLKKFRHANAELASDPKQASATAVDHSDAHLRTRSHARLGHRIRSFAMVIAACTSLFVPPADRPPLEDVRIIVRGPQDVCLLSTFARLSALRPDLVIELGF